MNEYNYKYKCNVCGNEDIIKFENMVNLFYVKCSKCNSQSEFIERTTEKEHLYIHLCQKKKDLRMEK